MRPPRIALRAVSAHANPDRIKGFFGMTPHEMTMRLGRRPDLDWLRVAAFALLILYHTGMVFVTWDYHVKTAHPSDLLEPAMLLVNPWRLSVRVCRCAPPWASARPEREGARSRLGRPLRLRRWP
jgi:hypothetical protein